MKMLTKVFLGAVAGGAAVQIWRRYRQNVEAEAAADDNLVILEVTEIVGLSEVDPEALMQVSGEGIDADANASAREDIEDQRERMPRPGKTVP